jgi:hypothetical protein
MTRGRTHAQAVVSLAQLAKKGRTPRAFLERAESAVGLAVADAGVRA